jgi:hypothetical protein
MTARLNPWKQTGSDPLISSNLATSSAAADEPENPAVRAVADSLKVGTDKYVRVYKKSSEVSFDQGEVIMNQSEANGETVYVVTNSNEVAVVRMEAGVHHINGWLPKGSIIGLVPLLAPISFVSTVQRCVVIEYNLVMDVERARKVADYGRRSLMHYNALKTDVNASTGFHVLLGRINTLRDADVQQNTMARFTYMAPTTAELAEVTIESGDNEETKNRKTTEKLFRMNYQQVIVTRHVDIKVSLLQFVRGFANSSVTIEKLESIVNFQDAVTVQEYTNVQNIINSADVAHDVFFLLAGKAEVVVGTAHTQINVYEPMVSIFGERAIVFPKRQDGQLTRTATVRPLSPKAHVLQINVPRLYDALTTGLQPVLNYAGNAFETVLDPTFKAIRMGLLEHISETNALNASHKNELNYKRITVGDPEEVRPR